MVTKMDSVFYEKLAQTVIDCDIEECEKLVNEALDKGADPLDILDNGLSKGIKKVGDDFEAKLAFLPELIGAADVMKAAVAILDEKLREAGTERKSAGKVVIGTVKGDIHDIGKSLVAAVLSANGYDVVDIGIDVENEAFVKAVDEYKANVIAMSSLLTLNIQEMGVVVKLLKDAGKRDQVKVIVGGAPVTQEFADGIGADAFGHDAADAVVKIDKLLGVVRK